MTAERTKIHDLLEGLIEKMDSDRSKGESKAEKKMQQLEAEAAARRDAELQEQKEQEKIARAVVDQENAKFEKADEIAELYVELKKKAERGQNTLRAVKAESERVRRDLKIA